MKPSQIKSFIEPSYLESGCENSNSSLLKSYDSNLAIAKKSVDCDQANSWPSYSATNRGEAWCQSQYDSLLY